MNKQKEKELNKLTEKDVFNRLEELNKERKIYLDGWKTCYGGNQYVTHVRFGWGGEISLTVLTIILNELLDLEPIGEVVVTTNEDGECVLVSRQDEDHKILKVIWEKK